MQGVLGAFHELDSAVDAIEDLKKERVGDITVYTPTPRHEFEHAIEHAAESRFASFTLIVGLGGVTFGYWIPIWMFGLLAARRRRQGDRDVDSVHHSRLRGDGA